MDFIIFTSSTGPDAPVFTEASSGVATLRKGGGKAQSVSHALRNHASKNTSRFTSNDSTKSWYWLELASQRRTLRSVGRASEMALRKEAYSRSSPGVSSLRGYACSDGVYLKHST